MEINIDEELRKPQNKNRTLQIAKYIGDDQEKFKELIGIFLKGQARVTQMSAAVLNACVSTHPALISPYIHVILENLKNNVHNAVVRNTIRILQFVQIPEESLGLAADICFTLLQSAKEPVANRVFAMTVLFNISQKHQELKPELKLIIEDNMTYGSAAFKSRGAKILKKLELKTSLKKKASN
jgi:hypothetical protein